MVTLDGRMVYHSVRQETTVASPLLEHQFGPLLVRQGEETTAFANEVFGVIPFMIHEARNDRSMRRGQHLDVSLFFLYWFVHLGPGLETIRMFNPLLLLHLHNFPISLA